MKARIWRQIMLVLNLFTGCPFSVNGLERKAFLICWCWGLRASDTLVKGLLESLPLGPRVRSLGGGFQAVHTVCSQSGSSSQLQYMQVDVCGAGVPSW